jgi:DNA-directed RNA polymerase subunit M/transcription elongation factor TFIIS
MTKKEVVSCPDCSQLMKVPLDDRLLKVTCKQCQNNFLCQSGRVLIKYSESSQTEQDSLASNFSGVVLAVLFILAIAVGVLSAGYMPLIKGKGIWLYLLFATPITLFALAILEALVNWLTVKSLKANRIAFYLIFFMTCSAYINGFWYRLTPDDSLVEKPLHQVMAFLRLPNERQMQASKLLTQLRDEMMTKNYRAANRTLDQLEDFYHYNPDRFYYYRALVSDRLGETQQTNIYASRYLRRLDKKGNDFKTAQQHYISSKATSEQ